ncbi:beta-galactosidase-1-like protein 2 isoform X1 [Maylandia zebra]|uniref:beta-galactosidase-1-like protein 2 n=1 Tax=Maylandia zebra TaxID=106582 RepID=UPI00032A046E|nr:beta-galactosidase-1-like protein 2 [Maylandia zebra]
MSRLEGLKANSSQFTLEGEPFRILGGSVHYFRVPRAYWEDRLLKMKACGLNTLTTYVPWNLHEPERGTFNFQDQLDLKAYVSLAAQLGLWVILRPGPYICAEWDLGGLPSWLLQDEEMQLRTTYPGFVNAVNLYFDKLISVIKPLMFEGGGPIIAVQVENEYGSFAKDDKYMPFIKNCLQSRGIKELLMTSDNWEGLRCGGVEGALKTINLQRLSFGAIQHLADIQPQKPLMVMEYWSGWFDVWGEHHHVFHAEDMLAVVSEILDRGVSINLYMFHGGTSFGFMNGAMDFGAYKSQVTSYDYDAPLSEAGDCTPKYHHLRNLFSQYHSEPLPGVPSSPERKAYSPAFIQQHLSLWDILQFSDKPHKSDKPVNMENLPVNNNNGQSYGYTLYETTITGGGALNSRNNIRDRAVVFVNRECVGCLDYKTHEVALPDGKGERTLSFLVENCGRVNYGKALDEQRKGIVGDIVLNNTPLRGFSISCFDMKPSFIKRLTNSGQWKTDFKSHCIPGFFQARLCVDGPPKDTFVSLRSWGKGIIFVNGQNLGRYWFIGPQHFLYLPAPWLRSGENEIIVFEEQRVHDKLLFAENPDYGKVIDVYKLPFCTLL